jgi:hypothetical protein
MAQRARVGGGVGTRRAPDRALVDVDDAVDLVKSLDALGGRSFHARTVQARGRVPEERVDDERRLARSGDAGDAGEEPERHLRGHVAQIVAACPDDRDLARRVGPHAQTRQRNAALAREVLPGDRGRVRLDVLRSALRHQLPAVRAGPRTEVHHVVGRADRLLVVLDHDHRVAQIAQLLERGQQPAVVALMQADRGLIEDIHDAGEA